MIDLHCHSQCSDGLLSPALLLKRAEEAGVQVLALTDHDTVAGVAALHHAAQNSPVITISGIELSTRWKKQDIHIIGLQVNPNHPMLVALTQQQNERRIARAHEISLRIEALLGLANVYNKACDLAGHDRVGRPHFAQLMVNEGLVPDLQTAFTRYLKQGRAAYVPTMWPSIEMIVSAILQTGGQAVLAHPLKYGLTRTKLRELIYLFRQSGGVGMEVVSGETALDQMNDLAGLCTEFDLLASTGSDYHGEGISRVGLGQQRAIPKQCKPIWQQWGLGV